MPEPSKDERLKIAAQDFSKVVRSKQEIYSILLTQGKFPSTHIL